MITGCNFNYGKSSKQRSAKARTLFLTPEAASQLSGPTGPTGPVGTDVPINDTIFVDGNFGDDLTGQVESMTFPFKTIAAALLTAAANPGTQWLIYIQPGGYVENITPINNADFEGSNADNTIIYGTINDTLTTDIVNISNLTFYSTTLTMTKTALSDINFKNCILKCVNSLAGNRFMFNIQRGRVNMSDNDISFSVTNSGIGELHYLFRTVPAIAGAIPTIFVKDNNIYIEDDSTNSQLRINFNGGLGLVTGLQQFIENTYNYVLTNVFTGDIVLFDSNSSSIFSMVKGSNESVIFEGTINGRIFLAYANQASSQVLINDLVVYLNDPNVNVFTGNPTNGTSTIVLNNIQYVGIDYIPGPQSSPVTGFLKQFNQVTTNLFGGQLTSTAEIVVANYTITESDTTILATAAAITITLPTASKFKGRFLIIKNANAGGAITVNPVGGNTVDGAGSLNLVNLASVILVSDGLTNWWAVN